MNETGCIVVTPEAAQAGEVVVTPDAGAVHGEARITRVRSRPASVIQKADKVVLVPLQVAAANGTLTISIPGVKAGEVVCWTAYAG